MDTNEYMQHIDSYHSDGSQCYCEHPYDLNGACVILDKNAKDNLSNVEENIGERFDLD